MRHFVCMDDRPLHCKQLQGISDAIKAWHHWSEKMGLPESPEKTQVCGKGFKKKQTRVFERHPDWAQTDKHNSGKLDLLKPGVLFDILLGTGQMLVPLNGCS